MATIYGTNGNNTLRGTSGVDYLYGYGGNDKLYGYSGNDRLYGGPGIDTMYGGLGNDWYFVDSASDITTETSYWGGYDTVFSSATYVLSFNVEKLVLLGNSAINGWGNNDNNYLKGNNSDNFLSGHGGGDILYGEAGDDSLYGRSGEDVLYGGEGEDVLSGGQGNDTLHGGTGDDVLSGGGDIDTMIGGDGNDTYWVNRYADTIEETSSSGGYDMVYSSSYHYGLLRWSDSYVEKLVLLDSTPATNGYGNILNNRVIGNRQANGLWGNEGNDYINGNAGNDRLYGGPGSDTIYGGEGNDILNGGEGVDTMTGGTGNDAYYVDSYHDVIQETNASGGYDTVFSDVTFGFLRWPDSYVEKLVLQGSASINGYGNTLNNRLIGNSGDNELWGHEGNDYLNGNDGNDSLVGGAGADEFTFCSALNSSANVDTISDFSSVQGDTINMDQTIFTNLSTGTLSSDYFRSSTGGTAADSNDYILYNTTSGALFYDADGNGSGTAVQFALLSNKPSLIASDFNVIA